MKVPNVLSAYIQTPCVLLMAWKQACCWVSVWSAECWSWSPADIFLGPENRKLLITFSRGKRKATAGLCSAERFLNLGWFVHCAVVSEVLLLRLHIVYGLLLGSVLQPGDRPTDPLEELEAERKMRPGNKKRVISSVLETHEQVNKYNDGRCTHASYSHHSPVSRSPPSSAHSPDWQPELCRYGLRLSRPIRKQFDE